MDEFNFIIPKKYPQLHHGKVTQQQVPEDKELQGCHLQKAEVLKVVGVMRKGLSLFGRKKNHKILHWQLGLGTWCRKTQCCNLVNASPSKLGPYLLSYLPSLNKMVGSVNLAHEPLQIIDPPSSKQMYHGDRRKRLKWSYSVLFHRKWCHWLGYFKLP